MAGGECRVSVAVRLRPAAGCGALEVDEQCVVDRSGARWRFDHVFGPTASTWQVYEATAQPIVEAFCTGQSGCVVVCGPRQAGKRFTMQGGGSSPGLVQLAAAQLWDGAARQLHVSYLEVSDSGPHDLLADRPLRGWPEMTRRPVRAPEDLMRCLLLGNKRRREKCHEVFLVHIEDARAVLSLVELAAGDSEALQGLCGVLRGARPEEPLTQLLCCALEASSRAVILCAIAGDERESRRLLDFFGKEEEALARLERQVQALLAGQEEQQKLEGRVRDLEMETQELRLALRMAREAFEERSVDLEERFKGLAAGRGKEEPAEGKEEPSSPKKGGSQALLVASELMRRFSAEERMEALIAEGGAPVEVPKERPSPTLLALPAPPTPPVTEAEARQSRIRQLQQELARQREALGKRRRLDLEEPAPTSAMRSEGEAALSELREQLKQREAEDLACPEAGSPREAQGSKREEVQEPKVHRAPKAWPESFSKVRPSSVARPMRARVPRQRRDENCKQM